MSYDYALNCNDIVFLTGWGCRHTIAVLVSFGSAVSYSMRFNLSIAIVAMVAPRKSHELKYDYGNSSVIACPNLVEPVESFALPSHDDASHPLLGHSGGGEFGWSEVEQGVILGSFFWGYILTQIPGGILTKKFGGKWPLGFGLLISAIFAILTPWAARTSRKFLIAARIIQGMGSVSFKFFYSSAHLEKRLIKLDVSTGNAHMFRDVPFSRLGTS